MNKSNTSKSKWLMASVALLGVSALFSAKGLDVASLARLALGAIAVACLVAWVLRARTPSQHGSAQHRLKVVSRAGLSQHCGVALIEAEGKAYLVLHGNGFAEIRETSVPEEKSASAPAFRSLLLQEMGVQ